MLTDRQLHLLNVIVEDFVDSGTPIGSKALLDSHQLNVSAATIRAEMKKLEEYGLIEKTHSSSGRMPSEAGYKFYVETLQNDDQFTQKQFDHQVDFQSLARAIANETHYLSVAASLVTDSEAISQIHLTYLTPTNLVLIIVYKNGQVEHQQISWQVRLTRQELERLNNYLNENLVRLSEMGPGELPQNIKQLPLSYLKREIVKKTQSTKQSLYFEGIEYLYDMMVPDNLNAVKETLKLIESNHIDTLIQKLNDEKLFLTHGSEIDSVLNGISIVSAPLKVKNQQGKIAVIGPTNMSYKKVFNHLMNVYRQL